MLSIRSFRAPRGTLPLSFGFVLLIPALAQHQHAQALSGHAVAQGDKPAHLRCDSLTEPLGIDTPRPVLSWQLNDARRGARQTAYEITISSKPYRTSMAPPDIWDSGRIPSDQSAGVPYGGPALSPSKRYFWRVKVWGQDGRPYPVSDESWWETGLLEQANWKAQWIGYEDAELHSIRASHAQWITTASPAAPAAADTHYGFRLAADFDRPVKRAVLYATGEDTAAAWVNDQQVLRAQPLTAWKAMPWATYVRQDVTSAIHPGKNLLAIDITRYLRPGQRSLPLTAPMSACLYVLFADGTTRLLATGGQGWKASRDAPEGWWKETFIDASWKPAEPYLHAGEPLTLIPWPTGPVALLRRSFRLQQEIVSARLYATALGAYKFHLNGMPVGDQMLAPGWMDFREHVPYQVYDVTTQIRRGENALAAYLAPGWYSTPLRFIRQGNNYGKTQPALRAQLRLQHRDGSVEWIVTDKSWKAESSPILQAEIYDGETFDARRQITGWDGADFADTTWHAAMPVFPAEPRIEAQYFQPIREERVLDVNAITSPSAGTYIFDFGQNMTAVPRLRVHGAAGEDIQLRFGEVLNPDGTLYTENLRTARATDHFILAGSIGAAKPEQFQPEFTFHGFRYAEISGLTEKPTAETLKAVVLHTDAPITARFHSGDPMVNQLWSNILWGQRSNFIGVPTDCPQRDERLGWSADAQVFWRTASYNMDLTAFSQKYAADLQGTQATTPMYGIYAPGVDAANPGYGAAWSDAGVIIPWTGWIQSGNTRIIDENWSGMQKYVAEIERKNPDFLWRNGFGAAFGDWLTPTVTTPEDLLATAYWAYDVSLLRQMAQATGRIADAERYNTLFAKIRSAFQKEYVRADGFVGTPDRFPSIPPPTMHPEEGKNSMEHPVETQTAYVLALYMDLLPKELRGAAADKLVEKIKANHWLLGTGFLGTPYLLEVLTDTGHSDVAYRLLLNHDYPSWGYLIDHGATTTWERWNGDRMRNDPSMNSYNHYAYGAVAEWIYRYAAGVDTLPASPGFHTLSLHPNFDAKLGSLDFDYDSAYGTIHSNWSTNGSQVTWKLTVPPNTTALLHSRQSNAENFKLQGTAAERSVTPALGPDPGDFLLQSGTYTFAATLKQHTSPAVADAR